MQQVQVERLRWFRTRQLVSRCQGVGSGGGDYTGASGANGTWSGNNILQ